jgi:hypothetical protein
MKKIFTLITMAVLALTFAACDNRYYDDYYRGSDYYDSEDAFVLEGTWTGYIETYLYDRFGMTGNDYRTTMYFERENAYGGWGYEVDYDVNNRYDDYYYCEFDWEVYNGSIRIRYADSWNDVYISDYQLSSSRFEGYMDDGTTKEILFRLSYDSRFDWGYWTTRSTTRSTNDSILTSQPSPLNSQKVKASGKFAK